MGYETSAWWIGLKQPIVYSYNPDTYAYEGEYAQQADQRRKGEWIMPGHATKVKPPEYGKGQIPVFDRHTETWWLESDHRGETWYDCSGREHKITKIGDPNRSGWVPVRPPLKDNGEAYRVLTAVQFFQMLIKLGFSRQKILDSLSDPESKLYIDDEQKRNSATVDFNYANVFARNNWLMTMMQDSGLVDKKSIDEAWEQATKLRANELV